jgi:hypothetical protein
VAAGAGGGGGGAAGEEEVAEVWLLAAGADGGGDGSEYVACRLWTTAHADTGAADLPTAITADAAISHTAAFALAQPGATAIAGADAPPAPTDVHTHASYTCTIPGGDSAIGPLPATENQQ